MDSRTGVLRPLSQAFRLRRGALAALLAVVGAVVLLGGLLLGSSTAGAQNDLVTSEPADGAVLGESPDEIVLTFAESVGNSNNVTIACNGQPFTGISQPVVSNDQQTLTVEVREETPSGTCTVAWGVSQEDGRPGAEGSFTFSVESGTPGTAPSDADDGQDTDGTAAAEADGDEQAAGDQEAGDAGGTEDTEGTAATQDTEPAGGGDASDDGDGNESTRPDGGDGAEVAGESGEDEASGGALDDEGAEGSLWAGRLLSTVGMSMVLGSLVLLAIAWPEGPEYVIAVRFIRSAWAVAVLGTIVYVAAATASVTGSSFGSSLNPLEWGELADAGWPGRAAIARVVLVLAMGWVVALPERAVQPSTQLPALAIPVLAVATIGLTRTDGDLAALGVIMGVLHAVAMAIWLGGAIFVSRIVLAGSGGDDLVHATRGFGRIAMPALIVTVLTGLVQLFRLDGGSLFSEGHGRVLLLKSLFVAAILFIAIAVQQVVRARLVRAREMDLRTSDRLRRAFGFDAALGVIVVGLTGWMLTFQPGSIEADPPPDEPQEETVTEAVIENEEAGIDMAVEIAPGTVGENEISVRVLEPEDGLDSATLTFVPPPGSEQGPVEQALPPIDGRSVVVLAPGDEGLPFEVAGTWTLEVSASTDTGSISGRQATFEIRNADGSVPPSRIEEDQGDEGDGGDGPAETDGDQDGQGGGDGANGGGGDGAGDGDGGGDDEGVAPTVPVDEGG